MPISKLNPAAASLTVAVLATTLHIQYTPCMTVYLVVSLPKITYIHRHTCVCTVLANPRYHPFKHSAPLCCPPPKHFHPYTIYHIPYIWGFRTNACKDPFVVNVTHTNMSEVAVAHPANGFVWVRPSYPAPAKIEDVIIQIPEGTVRGPCPIRICVTP